MSGKLRIKAKTVDEYLAALPADQRAALEKLRRDIRAAAPGAEECLSYALPAFRLDGRVLSCFGAATQHCSFYPGSGTTVAAHQELLKGYDTSKGAIRFPADKPLPAALVRTLVKARIAENAAKRPASGLAAAGRAKSRSRPRSRGASAAPPPAGKHSRKSKGR